MHVRIRRESLSEPFVAEVLPQRIIYNSVPAVKLTVIVLPFCKAALILPETEAVHTRTAPRPVHYSVTIGTVSVPPGREVK